ncbi:ester cyclase [Streptomyces pactum]|uniref:Ester cyclase n=1 Tax=Streptomyces pactum TaxID=68249 RepID=A0ABS0NT49_9ACTN|nr:ester cyclase [Streptomyces pactum]MBH5338397.1 ester cyclase [Streptomyces pactum]
MTADGRVAKNPRGPRTGKGAGAGAGAQGGDGFRLTTEHILKISDLSWSDDNSRALPHYAPDFTCHLPGRPVLHGGQEFLGTLNLVRAAKPDVRIDWHDILIDGDQAVLHVTFRGTHLGPLFGIPPTGRRLEIGEIIIEKYDDQGRMREFRQEGDYAGMLTQMGVVPPPGTGPLGTIAHSVRTAVRLTRLDRAYRRRNPHRPAG